MDGNIIAVDDNREHLLLLKKILENEGFVVRAVASSKLALSGIMANPPDLVISDIRMPHMTGYELLKKLKENKKTENISVIFITASSDIEDKIRAFSLGGIDFLTKPYKTEELIARVKSNLQRLFFQKQIEEKNRLLEETTHELENYKNHLEQLVQERTEHLVEMNSRLETEIQQKKKAQKAAEAASEAKTQFLANMSHELRTPLNGIIGLTRLVCDSQLTDQQKEMLDLVLTSAYDLFDIIQDILNFTNIHTRTMKLKRTWFNLKDLIWEILDHEKYLLLNKALRISINVHENCAEIFNDKLSICQIMVNVISNAIKYTKQGNIIITAYREDKIYITVEDTGEGIPEDQKENIFDSFKQLENTYTKEHRGIGLGLTTVKSLLEILQGTIHVESKIGKGSKFIIELPIEEIEMKPDAISAVADNKTFLKNNNVKVLIAEDEAINRMYISHLIEKQGWQVEEAKNGKEVLDMVQYNQYDIILIDIGMPRMNGIEATLKIRSWEKDQGHSHTPIFALTAHAFREDELKSLDAGIDKFFTKPIEENRLITTIKNYISLS